MNEKINISGYIGVVTIMLLVLGCVTFVKKDLMGFTSFSIFEPKGKNYRFIIHSDIHVGMDNKVSPRYLNAVEKTISLNPSFVVLLGDMASGNSATTYSEAKQSWKALGEAINPLIEKGIGIVPLAGNHDAGFENDDMLKAYNEWAGNYPALPASLIEGRAEKYYAFEYGNDLFIALYSPYISLDDEQMHWLKETIRKANTPQKKYSHIFVLSHIPVVSLTWEEQNLKNSELAQILVNGNVDYFFGGHEHVVGESVVGGKTKQIQCGTAGSSYHKADKNDKKYPNTLVMVDVRDDKIDITYWKGDSFTETYNPETGETMEYGVCMDSIGYSHLQEQSIFMQHGFSKKHIDREFLDKIAPYESIIREAAANYNVAPELIRAIIRIETGGDLIEDCKRSICGIMQISFVVCRDSGVCDIDKLKKGEPRDAIFGGAWYLNHLTNFVDYLNKGKEIEKTNQNYYWALAVGYNAGPASLQSLVEHVVKTRYNGDYSKFQWRDITPEDISTSIEAKERYPEWHTKKGEVIPNAFGAKKPDDAYSYPLAVLQFLKEQDFLTCSSSSQIPPSPSPIAAIAEVSTASDFIYQIAPNFNVPLGYDFYKFSTIKKSIISLIKLVELCYLDGSTIEACMAAQINRFNRENKDVLGELDLCLDENSERMQQRQGTTHSFGLCLTTKDKVIANDATWEVKEHNIVYKFAIVFDENQIGNIAG